MRTCEIEFGSLEGPVGILSESKLSLTCRWPSCVAHLKNEIFSNFSENDDFFWFLWFVFNCHTLLPLMFRLYAPTEIHTLYQLRFLVVLNPWLVKSFSQGSYNSCCCRIRWDDWKKSKIYFNANWWNWLCWKQTDWSMTFIVTSTCKLLSMYSIYVVLILGSNQRLFRRDSQISWISIW